MFDWVRRLFGLLSSQKPSRDYEVQRSRVEQKSTTMVKNDDCSYHDRSSKSSDESDFERGGGEKLSPGEINRQRVKENLNRPLSKSENDVEPVKLNSHLQPTRICFVDVETTGLTELDRIVSFAGIFFDASKSSQVIDCLSFVHIICDPGRKSHPRAEEVHGYSDWVLRHQESFSQNAEDIVDFLSKSEIIVSHNAEFDIKFINRELVAAGFDELNKPTFCTMQSYRQRTLGRSSLSAAAAHIGLARSGVRHGALEDAWLAMMIYFWLHKIPQQVPFSVFGNAEPKNLRPSSPLPAGPLPRRKKVPSVDSQISKQATRNYSNEHLSAAWELFEDKDYVSALERAYLAIRDDVEKLGSLPDGRPYEIACMILRRQVRLSEEQELLWEYFRRVLGPEVTRDQIFALSVPSWETWGSGRADSEAAILPALGQRPNPERWELATRFARVTERLEKSVEPNEERLQRALNTLPIEESFKEAAICIRKLIADKMRKHEDPRNELTHLHKLAQQHAFLNFQFGAGHPEQAADHRAWLWSHVAAEIATQDDLNAIVGSYQQVGYQYLPLLNKTDTKRLIKVFGEPTAHIIPRENNKMIWERYRKEARRQKRGIYTGNVTR
jgi:DNA polymerase-3 subunit epsilon